MGRARVPAGRAAAVVTTRELLPRVRKHRGRRTSPVRRPPSLSLVDLSRPRAYFTRLLSLKIGRMMLMAMKPTTLPMTTIMSGSIIDVTVLMTLLSSLE